MKRQITRAEAIEKAALAVVKKARVHPGGYRFGFPTWQLDHATYERLIEALAIDCAPQTDLWK